MFQVFVKGVEVARGSQFNFETTVQIQVGATPTLPKRDVRVEITNDDFPGENTWEIEDASGVTVMEGKGSKEEEFFPGTYTFTL
jgi:hypothetical protein